jgi:hypothetical protein
MYECGFTLQATLACIEIVFRSWTWTWLSTKVVSRKRIVAGGGGVGGEGAFVGLLRLWNEACVALVMI